MWIVEVDRVWSIFIFELEIIFLYKYVRLVFYVLYLGKCLDSVGEEVLIKVVIEDVYSL